MLFDSLSCFRSLSSLKVSVLSQYILASSKAGVMFVNRKLQEIADQAASLKSGTELAFQLRIDRGRVNVDTEKAGKGGKIKREIWGIK